MANAESQSDVIPNSQTDSPGRPNAKLMTRLIQAFPVLSPLLEDHLKDQEGELLPYLLMADVERWAEAEVVHQRDHVSDLIAWLEREFASGGNDIKDLIGVGFVEMVPHTPEGDPILQNLGPHLRDVAEQMGLFTPAASE